MDFKRTENIKNIDDYALHSGGFIAIFLTNALFSIGMERSF